MNVLASLILDPYERSARLAPAMIVLLPLLLLGVVTPIFSKPVVTQIMAVFGACGMAFLLSNVARLLGKAKEPAMYDAWGGAPTTQLLRHRDSQIDSITKRHYHAFLERKTKTSFPSAEEEQSDPGRADESYRAGVKWLLGKTRDKKQFPLLAKENISYGFHRSGFGMRPLGLACVALAIGYWIVRCDLIKSGFEGTLQWSAILELPPSQVAILTIYLLLGFLWSFYFTRNRVKQAAFAYAEMLLRSCDVLR